MRLARPRIALDEQARREQFLHVDADRILRGVGSDGDAAVHDGWQLAGRGRGGNGGGGRGRAGSWVGRQKRADTY